MVCSDVSRSNSDWFQTCKILKHSEFGTFSSTIFETSGLTLIQTRFPSFKDELVERVESAIVSQYEQFAGSTVAMAKQRYEGEKEDEESEEDSENNNGSKPDGEGAETKKAKWYSAQHEDPRPHGASKEKSMWWSNQCLMS